MKKIVGYVMMLATLASCSTKEYKLEANFPEKFNGKTAVLATYDDTLTIDSAAIADMKVEFKGETDSAFLAQLIIDGRTKAYVVVEPGKIILPDSAYTAKGTMLNDRLTEIIVKMDSVESLDDMGLYVDFVARQYDLNKSNPLGLFFASEYVRFSELPQIDSVLASASEQVKNSHRVARYRNAALLRAATTPGKMFTDFSARQPNGKLKKLSDIAGRGKYVLVDFFASWCPYCIKEIPQLKELYSAYKDKGFEIVGVAVRDKAEDTKATVDKHEINWEIIYNAERKPYDIYGFIGIPHLMLLAPDGTIVSRGETAKQIAERMRQIYEETETPKK